MALPGTQIHVGHYVRWQQYHLEGLFTSGIAQCELERARQTWLQVGMEMPLQLLLKGAPFVRAWC